MNIYKIYYNTEPSGFFSKLFGRKRKISDDSKRLAGEYFNAMQEVSNELLQEINRMERRVVAIPEKEFEGI